MTRFQPYEPDDHGSPLAITVRAASTGDEAVIAELIAARDDLPLATTLVGVQGELERIAADGAKHKHLCVAEHAGAVIGFGRTTLLPMSTIPGTSGMPDGWYLTGLIVVPAHRRQGVGRALTTARLEWLGQRTESACYFTSAQNLASIRFHEAFGFREVSREVRFPGMTFTGGIGLCYALALR